jgi:hypothetical protein
MPREELRQAMRAAASALSADEVPFALGGSYALWVHGASEPSNDVDLVVPEAAVENAAKVLADAGFDVERTVEDWLFKARLGNATVDVLHRLNGNVVGAELVETAQLHDVLGVRMPVIDAQETVIVKLRSLSEHYCDFGALLAPIRAVREQLDWHEVERRTADNDFAAALLFLLRRLGVIAD